MMHRRLGTVLFTTGLLLASPAAAQLGGAPDSGPSLWRVMGALLLCILLAGAGALALKARSGGATGPLPWVRSPDHRRLKLVESIRLTPQVQLCIVACGEREILVSTSPNGARLLGDVAPADEGLDA